MKLESKKFAKYSGTRNLNVRTKSGVHLVKKAGEVITATELADLGKLAEDLLSAGQITIHDEPAKVSTKAE